MGLPLENISGCIAGMMGISSHELPMDFVYEHLMHSMTGILIDIKRLIDDCENESIECTDDVWADRMERLVSIAEGFGDIAVEILDRLMKSPVKDKKMRKSAIEILKRNIKAIEKFETEL